VTILLLASLLLSFLWLVVVLVASMILRRRVFWLLIGAPGALCWPVIFLRACLSGYFRVPSWLLARRLIGVADVTCRQRMRP